VGLAVRGLAESCRQRVFLSRSLEHLFRETDVGHRHPGICLVEDQTEGCRCRFVSQSQMKKCPDVSQLSLLLKGDGHADLGDLATHIDVCPNCLERLDQLARQDAPPLRLGRFAAAQTPDSDARVARLIQDVPFLDPRGDRMSAPPPIAPPTPEIPGLERLELVGRGGSGHVYRAWQTACDRWVALKILNPAKGFGWTPRVLREARFLGRINHPHIVRILDSGTHEGQPYLVMEWIGGGTLDARLRESPLSFQETAQLGQQIASALESVHALGIVHRDLKPANVVLEEEASPANGLVAKLTDFGIARDDQAEERLTSTGMILGTPQYMSPEQTGLSPDTLVVGPASDIYGVGAILFACLTGQPPHSGGGMLSTISRVARIEPPAPRTLRGDIPVDLDTIVIKCLRRNPAHRYRSAGELAEDLNCFLRGLPIAARPYTPVEKLGNWLRRHPVAATTLAMAGLLLLTLLGGGLYHLRANQALIGELSKQRDLAETQTQQAREAARRADDKRDEALRLALSASQALLSGVSPQLSDRRRIIEVVRANQLAESDDPGKLTLEQAEILGGALLNLTHVELRDSLVDFHQQDTARIVRLAQYFPQSDSLRRCAALSLLGQHALQLGQNQVEEARQTSKKLVALGDLEPNEQIGMLQCYRNQAIFEEQRGGAQQALATLDEVCAFAECYLERDRSDYYRWLILLDLRHQRAETAIRHAIPAATAFAPWEETLRHFLATPSDGTEATLIQRGRVVSSQIDRATFAQRFDLARQLLDATRADALTAQRLDPNSAGLIQFRMERARFLGRLALSGSLTPVEEEELQQALDAGRAFQRSHPGQSGNIPVLSQTLLFQAKRQLAAGLSVEAETTAREVLALLTPWGGSPAPFADFSRQLCDAYLSCSDALRGSSRVAERRLHLVAACLFADANRRPGVALELVKLLVELPDLVEAERVRDWIPRENPAQAEAQSLIEAARNDSRQIEFSAGETRQSNPVRTGD